jgi:hypothetical protein
MTTHCKLEKIFFIYIEIEFFIFLYLWIMFCFKKTLCRQIYLSVFMSEKYFRMFWTILVGITHYAGTESQLMKLLTGALNC